MQETIGFDLDGVFIGHPPLISFHLLDILYKDNQKKNLTYRFPGQLEQQIRKLTHLPFVRPPISANCEFLKKIHNSRKYKIILLSGRFGFLKDLTHKWLEWHNLDKVFDKIYLNMANLQPHLFKLMMLKKIKLDKYVEDDFDSISFLAKKIPGLKFYWYNNLKVKEKLLPNIKEVNKLDEIIKTINQ